MSNHRYNFYMNSIDAKKTEILSFLATNEMMYISPKISINAYLSLIAARIEATVGMLLNLLIAITICDFHAFIKDVIKFFQSLFLHTFLFSEVCFGNLFVRIDNMIELTIVSNFDLDSGNIERIIVFSRIQEGIFIVNVQEINMDIFIDAILRFFVLGKFKFFLKFTLIFRCFGGVLCKIFFILLAIWLFRVYSSHDVIVQEVKEINLVLRAKLDALHLNDLALVFFQSDVDDTASGVEKAYYCLSKMEFDRFIFKWPSIIFEFLIGCFTEFSKNTGRFVLKNQSAAYKLLFFTLNNFCISFDPVQSHLFKKTLRFLHQQLPKNELIQFFSLLLSLAYTFNL